MTHSPAAEPETALPPPPDARPVLAGADGSGPATLAVAWAAEEALLRGTSVRICVVRDTRPFPRVDGVVLDRAVTVARLGAPDLRIDRVVRDGDPATVLAALSRDAQLTVTGHRGGGNRPFSALGSGAATLARTCASPLVVIRFVPGRPVPDRARPVVVAVDGTDHDREPLAFAAATAEARGTSLHVVHVWTEHLAGVARRLGHRQRRSERERAEAALASTVSGLAGRFPALDVESAVVRGRTAWTLLELSDSAQLVVVGRPPGHAPGLTTTTLVHAAGCPVAVVPVTGDAVTSDGACPTVRP